MNTFANLTSAVVKAKKKKKKDEFFRVYGEKNLSHAEMSSGVALTRADTKKIYIKC